MNKVKWKGIMITDKNKKIIIDGNNKSRKEALDEAISKIKDIYWFPHESEVYLISVENDIPWFGDEEVCPFYFDSKNDDIFYGVAIIHPEEFGKLTLPEGWGKWDRAVKLVR